MKATIVYLSKSKAMAIVSVAVPVGPVNSEVSGWMQVNSKVKKGDTFELPANAVVSTSVSDTKDGQTFRRLIISGV